MVAQHDFLITQCCWFFSLVFLLAFLFRFFGFARVSGCVRALMRKYKRKQIPWLAIYKLSSTAVVSFVEQNKQQATSNNKMARARFFFALVFIFKKWRLFI